MGLNTIHLNNSNLDHKWDNYDPETIVHVGFIVWCKRH